MDSAAPPMIKESTQEKSFGFGSFYLVAYTGNRSSVCRAELITDPDWKGMVLKYGKDAMAGRP